MYRVIQEDIQTIIEELCEFKGKITDKTFLVTGGAGFLGSWFCDILNVFGARVICLDNLSSGSKKNIKHLTKNKNFKFINADVCSFNTHEKIDYIAHLASIASPPLYQKFPVQTLDANVIGTRNMLELARRNDIKSFLFTSTSEIYGNPPDEAIPTPESYYGYVNPYGQRSMYDEGKRAAESYCYSYFIKYNLPIRIARIFNTYGPRLDIKSTSQYGRVIIKFIYQALNNKPITVYGDGKQTRSFCYITDQMEGLFKLFMTPKINGEVVNIGNSEEISILRLARKVKKLTKSNSKITFQPLPPDDPRRRCPDLTKAKKLLNFKPKVSLQKGLKRMIDWQKRIR
ncbi:MAG: SDR family oxidoreductase [Candidatus Aenigmarchaeota archaeon]|nr:SDR family oxidoreductase [Candidatus Aenigmarchaeota archaeon]